MYKNRCPSDFVGEYCTYPNPCHTSQQRCEHGGSCRVVLKPNSAPTFACDCPVGYTSSFCEIELPNVCQSNPCKNGVCKLESLQNFTCTCNPGYRGANCEHIDHCTVNGTNPCKNDAKCIPEDNRRGYRCICDEGFTGPNCLQVRAFSISQNFDTLLTWLTHNILNFSRTLTNVATRTPVFMGPVRMSMDLTSKSTAFSSFSQIVYCCSRLSGEKCQSVRLSVAI